MLIYFLLFSLIGFLPYVSVYIGLQLKSQFIRRILPTVLILFAAGSSIKLFMISVVLPELQEHSIQTFLATLFINSAEFIVFRYNFKKSKVKNTEKGNIIAFSWAALYAFVTSILVFISNSRSYELDIKHLSFALGRISFLFVYFAMERVVLSLDPHTPITNMKPNEQLLVLLLGLPSAISALDTSISNILALAFSVLIWALARKRQIFIQEKKKN